MIAGPAVPRGRAARISDALVRSYWQTERKGTAMNEPTWADSCRHGRDCYWDQQQDRWVCAADPAADAEWEPELVAAAG